MKLCMADSERYLKPTSDRKTRFWTNQYNTFGLLPGPVKAGGTCPGCTTGEGGCWHLAKGRKTHTCYVDGLMGCYKGVKAILQHNTDLLKSSTREEMEDILSDEFNRFRRVELMHARKSSTAANLHYRLHWSGDVFSTVYAEALKAAMEASPDIQFWTYTRSWDIVPILCTVPNLKLYLSLDAQNILSGLVCYDECDGPQNPKLSLA